MTEAARATARPPEGIFLDVEDDVVWPGRVAGDAAHCCQRGRYRGAQVIEAEQVPHPPGYRVIRAGRVAAHTHSTEELVPDCIETETASEHVDAADPAANHRVLLGTMELGQSGIRQRRIDGIAVLQPVEAPARIDCGIQVGGREREPGRLARAVA